MQVYHVIGLMSGTSLDGVDLAYCKFVIKNKVWEYEIIHSACYTYHEDWKVKLANAENTSALDIHLLDLALGKHFAENISEFIKKHKIKVLDFIASHGHTIFHQPANGLTLQIGSGAVVAAETGITTICDFRKMDVAMGGQGAPLVPIGDRDLFSSYNYCLNIGGIANVSFELNSQRLAYDICPANMILNHYLSDKNLLFDDEGLLARSGTVNAELLAELNKLDYYHQAFPKSLGKEWVLQNIYPTVDKYNLSESHVLATLVEHIAIQIAANCYKSEAPASMLITGGGAYHAYLIERINAHTSMRLIIPSRDLIEFKEALVFAFLGVLRFRNENNCLAAVTGAKKNNCGGQIFFVKTNSNE
jgi:anhydro-N-acetylmuramic acid kinase